MDDEESALLDGGRVHDMGGQCREGSQKVTEVWGEEERGELDSRGSLGEEAHIREAGTLEPRAQHAPPVDDKEGPHCGTLEAHRYEQAPLGEEESEGDRWRRSEEEPG